MALIKIPLMLEIAVLSNLLATNVETENIDANKDTIKLAKSPVFILFVLTMFLTYLNFSRGLKLILIHLAAVDFAS